MADKETVLLEMFRTEERRGVEMVGLPRGDCERVRKCFLDADDLDLMVDQRTDAFVDLSNLKFMGTFNQGQRRAARVLSRHENGVLKSAPRTGKCLDGNTLVATSHGILRLAHVPRGDMIRETSTEQWFAPLSEITVAGPDGPRVVRKIYRSHAPVYRMNTTSGHYLVATADERVWVLGGVGWCRLADLQPGDEIQVGGEPHWRRGGRSYKNLGAEHRRILGDRISTRFATLLGYYSRMQYQCTTADDVVHVDLDASSSCTGYARSMIRKFSGVEQPGSGDRVHLPGWLWRSVQEFGSQRYVPDTIRVGPVESLTSYLKALYESTGFQRWDGPGEFRLDWRLPTVEMAEYVQTVLENYGISVSRALDQLVADVANSALFLDTLDVRGIPHISDQNAERVQCRFVDLIPLGERPVYDLSVGDESEDEANFIANGLLVHNTIMGTQAIINAGRKTLILAHQTDLIEQFCDETINDPAGLLFNGDSFRRPIAAICNRYEDFLRYPVCLATYQSFINDRKGARLLELIKDMFGVVLIDEVHRAPATNYARILSRMSARYMWGLTATDDRKDGLYQITEMIVGPTVHRVKAQALSAKVYAVDTRLKKREPPKTWLGQQNYLFRERTRNALIARTALADVRRGHTVLIPVTRHEHAEALRTEIIRQCGDRKMVFTFTGKIPKQQRKWARAMMRKDRRARIHIANRSMLTGVNVPRWSAIYTVAPITNPPNYEQEIQRICTVMDGKPDPIIRYFYDGVLGPSFRWITICAQTLGSAELGHTLTQSFLDLARRGRPVVRDEDPGGPVRAAGAGMRDRGGGRLSF